MTSPVIFYNFSSSETSKVTDLRSKSDNLIDRPGAEQKKNKFFF